MAEWSALCALPSITPHQVWDVGFTPDGKFLATASNDGTARVWGNRTGRPLTPPLPVGTTAWRLEISPDGRWLPLVV